MQGGLEGASAAGRSSAAGAGFISDSLSVGAGAMVGVGPTVGWIARLDLGSITLAPTGGRLNGVVVDSS